MTHPLKSGQNPLTDEMIDEISEKYNLAVERSYDEDMRDAYELGRAKGREEATNFFMTFLKWRQKKKHVKLS